MGLFDFFYKKLDNTELAEQLFSTLGICSSIDKKYEKEVNRIINSLKDDSGYVHRQLVLDKIIELIGEPHTPKQRFIIAKAYAWSKASYRKQAIKYISLYLNNELYDEEYKHSSRIICGKSTTLDIEKNIHIANMLQYLGKSYEGEYEFEKALECFKRENELIYFFPHSYCDLINIYTKMNNLNEALKICNKAKETIYYKKTKYKDEILKKYYTDDTFKIVIDNQYQDIINKIEKGYKYKPRKKANY